MIKTTIQKELSVHMNKAEARTGCQAQSLNLCDLIQKESPPQRSTKFPIIETVSKKVLFCFLWALVSRPPIKERP